MTKDGNCVLLNSSKCQDKQFIPYTVTNNKYNRIYLLWYNEKGVF